MNRYPANASAQDAAPTFTPDQPPVVIDECNVQADGNGQPILPIIFHATGQTVIAIEFVFWVNDTFGDREGAIYGGITNGKFSAGAKIKPWRGGLLNRYYTRDQYPNNAVWRLNSLPVGEGGTIACNVYQVKFQDGSIWKDGRFAGVSPIMEQQ